MSSELADEAGVFLPYEAVVARLERTAKQVAGASIIRRGGLVILKLGCGESSSINRPLPEVWLQGGLHACEWIGPAVVLRLMDMLVQDSALRSRAAWYLLPVVDAQGYQRTWSGEPFLRTAEGGENLNMNFPFRWGSAPLLLRLLLGRKLRRWRGPRPASVDCVSELIAEMQSLKNLQLFLDFHGFGRLWLHPWCYSKAPSLHHAEHEAASSIAVAAANRLAGRGGYRAQAAAKTEVAMGGSCIDYVHGAIGCTHSYAVELPPSLPRGGPLMATLLAALKGNAKQWWKEGYHPDAKIGIEAGEEMAAALTALADHLFGKSVPPLVPALS